MKQKKQIADILHDIIKIIFAVFIFIAAALSLFYTCTFGDNAGNIYRMNFTQGNTLLVLSAAAFVFAALFLWRKYIKFEINPVYLLCALIVFNIIVSVIWLNHTPLRLTADQEAVSVYSGQLASGDLSSLERGRYLWIYNIQLGFVALCELYHKVFGLYNYTPFFYINMTFLQIAYIYLYRLTDAMFEDKRVNCMLVLLLFGCVFLTPYCMFFYPDILVIMLALISLFGFTKFMRMFKVKHAVISGLSLAAACMIRSSLFILLVAEVIVFTLALLKTKKKILALTAVLFILASMGAAKLPVLYYSARSGFDLSQNMPVKLMYAMGLSEGETAEGWWDGFSFFTYVENDFDLQKSNEAADIRIKERYSAFKNDPGYAAVFYTHKLASSIAEPTFCSFIQTYNTEAEFDSIGYTLYKGTANKLLQTEADIFQSVVYIGALIYVLRFFRRADISNIVPALMFIGGILFHTVLWETSSRYMLIYFMMLMPYAAASASASSTWRQGC